MNDAPAVSVIIATYNRSYVLRHSIASVLRSDFSDFEIIVVGDGCTDDTEEVVRGFADARISFVNLPENSGTQSAPNNAGIARARARIICFLNHDDLYFADHLGASLAFMERAGADIAWSPVLLLQHSGRETGLADASHDIVVLDGAVGAGGFDPRAFIVGSSWVVRAEVCRAVGPWRAAEATRLSPSQEWLFRAHAQGHRLVYHRHVSVLCIHAGVRRHSYVIRASQEHERAWSWITGGDAARAALLQCAAVEQAARLKSESDALRRFRREGRFPRARRLAVDALRRLGFHPVAVERFIDREPKGGWIAQIRRFTGEAPRLTLGQTLELGSSIADPYLGRGWHPPEADGRWTAERSGEILFSVAADAGDCALELSGMPLRWPGSVVFALNGQPALTHHYDAPETVVRLPLRKTGSFWLIVTVEEAASPASLGNSPDTRVLGFQLRWIRLVAAPGA
jgi:GT2 family glycosyltransferase